MQAHLPIDAGHEEPSATGPELSGLRTAPEPSAAEPYAEEGLSSEPAKAGADLPDGADPDLLLHAIQKREQRTFALKLTGILGGLALAAYLAGSGNGAILQGVIHLVVGAAAGAAAALLWKRRAR